MRCARRARVAGPRPAPANAAARPAQASLFVFELLTRRRPLRRHAPKAYVHGMRMLIPSHFFVASCEGRKPCERAGLARVREGVRESRATRIPALPDFFGPRGENLAKGGVPSAACFTRRRPWHRRRRPSRRRSVAAGIRGLGAGPVVGDLDRRRNQLPVAARSGSAGVERVFVLNAMPSGLQGGTPLRCPPYANGGASPPEARLRKRPPLQDLPLAT